MHVLYLLSDGIIFRCCFDSFMLISDYFRAVSMQDTTPPSLGIQTVCTLLGSQVFPKIG